MDITLAINAIQDLWLGISGIKAAPDTPTEAMNVFPFAMTYERSGNVIVNQSFNDTWSDMTSEIISELHLTRQNLPTAIAAAMAYRNSFLNALRANPNLSGNIMIIDSIGWSFGKLEWGTDASGQPIYHIGYVFTLGVRLELT